MWTAIAELLFLSSVPSDTVSEPELRSCLRGQMRGMECVLPSQSCHSPLLSSAIRSQSRVTVGPPVETDPERVNAVMRSSRPLMGDNGSTHSLSDVYYIQVHLSFRGSWPRVTPRAIKPDCGPNLAGTGT